MILSAPRSQGPPQPPLLPPPAHKNIPKPPPPPSSLPLLPRDCSADASALPHASGSKATAVLRNRAGRSSFSTLPLGTSLAGGGFVPIPPPSVPFQTSSNAPPPPPPESPAQFNLKQSQHIQTQPPLLVPLEPPRFSSDAHSPAHQESIRNTGTVLVLPPPCCPQQLRVRPDFQRSRLRAHNQRGFGGEEACLPRPQYPDCGCPQNHSPKSGRSAPSTKSLHEEINCNSQCNNAEDGDSERCHVAGDGRPGRELKQRFRCGWGATHTVENSLRVKLNQPSHTGDSLTSHKLKRTDPASLHFLHQEDSQAPQPSSPEWKGRRYRASTHLLCYKAIKEKSCKLALQQPLSQFLSLRCTTEPHLLATSHGPRHRKPSCNSSVSASESQQVEPPQIPPPPASLPEESVRGPGTQCVVPSSLRGGGRICSPARTSLTPHASPEGKVADKEEQSFLVSGAVSRGQTAYTLRAAQAGSSLLEAETNLRSSERLSSSRWWTGESSVKPCYSIASSSSSGSSSSSTQGDYETGAGDWNAVLPLWRDTAEPQYDFDELPGIRGGNRKGRKTSFFLPDQSFSDGPGETQECAESCSKEALERVDIDGKGTRRCSLHSSESQAKHAPEQGIDLAHGIRRDVDALGVTHGNNSVRHPGADTGTKPSIFRSSVSSFALTASTRSGLTRITVLSPPTETAEADKKRVPGWASISQPKMVGELPCGRAGESETLLRAKVRPGKMQPISPWSVPCMQGTAPRPVTPQKLRSPERFLKPSPCTATLSHLPPSPLTPLVLTDNSAEQLLPSLLLAGEQQTHCRAMLTQGEQARGEWTYNPTTQNSQGKAECESIYCEQALQQCPAVPSHAQSPRYAGSGGARYRRRKQNKVRRRLREKLRQEESGESRQLHAPAVPPEVSDEERQYAKNRGGSIAPTGVERTDSPQAAANEHLEKPTSKSSRTVIDSDLDNYTTEEVKTMPECEAWASSPAVVARHIKSRRLLRVDNDRRTDYVHNAQMQRDGCIPLLLDPDSASRLNIANACAFSGACAQEHHIQAKCNTLFMPSSCSSWPSYECERVTPHGAVLYTFELMGRQQYASRRHMSGRTKQSQMFIKAQQRKSQLLQKEEAQLHVAAPPKAVEIRQQAPVPLLPLPTSLGLPSRGCNTSTRPSSPVCISYRGRRLARRTSVSRDTEGTGQLSADTYSRRGGWCTTERASTCSSHSRVPSGPAERRCRNFLESRPSQASLNGHTVHQDHTTRPGHLVVCSKSAFGDNCDGNRCAVAPPTRGASSQLVPESAEAPDSAVPRDQESLGCYTHAGDNAGRLANEEVPPSEYRRGSVQHAVVHQNDNAPPHSFRAVNDRGTKSFDSSSTATCRHISRRTSTFDFCSTNDNGCRHTVVCQSEDSRARHGGESELSGVAMPLSDCDENRSQQLRARWAGTFCPREVMLKTGNSCVQAGLACSRP